MASLASEMTIEDAWEHIKGAVLIGWSRTTRRMRAAGGVIIFLYVLHSTYLLSLEALDFPTSPVCSFSSIPLYADQHPFKNLTDGITACYV